MTSREFYLLIDQALRPALEKQGFTRMKITASAWIKPLGDKFVMFQVEKGVKKPYIKPLGGKFDVWLHLVKAPQISQAHSETSISFLRYQTDDGLVEMKRIRQKILRKILSQTKFESEFDKTLLEMSSPIMESSFEHNFNRRQPWPLEYLDAEDVTAWGKFISTKVAASVEGISKEGDLALSYK
jgi:hypothetical protein